VPGTGKWQRNKYVGVSLVGKTLAVMGFGKVGSEVARRAKGLGMHVIEHDPYAAAIDRAHAMGVDLVSFDEAISAADFISLHMPLTPTTDKVFNDDNFRKMKKGVCIINVARGGVIDEEALVRALDSGIAAQVYIFFHFSCFSYNAKDWIYASITLNSLTFQYAKFKHFKGFIYNIFFSFFLLLL